MSYVRRSAACRIKPSVRWISGGESPQINLASVTNKAETLDQLSHLSNQLHIESTASQTQRYAYLQPPLGYRELKEEEEERSAAFEGPGGEVLSGKAMVTDWNEVLGIVHEMMVVPEMADQLSGAIYMHALMQEDNCTKCIRLADFVHNLSRDQILAILNNMALWNLKLADIHRSDMLQVLLNSLDKHLSSSSFQEDLFVIFGFCRIVRNFSSECTFLGRAFERMQLLAEVVASREGIVSLLLLAAFCHNSAAARPWFSQKMDRDLMRLIAVKVSLWFDELTPSELAACFAGLQSTAPSSHVDQLGQKIINRYGFRLH